jgi:large subunit ribosomal protein L28
MTRKCDLLNVRPMSGNKVSHSNRKSKRRFLPNLRELSFRSDTLGVDVNLRVSTSTLRTINKFGNIDNFLVNYRFNKMSDLAKKIRMKIKKKLIAQNKLQEIEINNSKKARKANKA